MFGELLESTQYQESARFQQLIEIAHHSNVTKYFDLAFSQRKDGTNTDFLAIGKELFQHDFPSEIHALYALLYASTISSLKAWEDLHEMVDLSLSDQQETSAVIASLVHAENILRDGVHNSTRMVVNLEMSFVQPDNDSITQELRAAVGRPRLVEPLGTLEDLQQLRDIVETYFEDPRRAARIQRLSYPPPPKVVRVIFPDEES